MSHEIESISYVGATPWHGIGFELKEAPTPKEMLISAKLDWTVSKRPLYTPDTDDYIHKPHGNIVFSNLWALIRNSDSRVLGVCGPRYEPFQNAEVFDFFDKFTKAGHMKMEVAGSLKNGLWVWALARLEGQAFKLMNDDINYSYLLLVSPHIWGEAMTIMFTSVRVVCWNTLTQAMNKTIKDKFRFIHNRGFTDVRALAELTVEQAMMHKMLYEEKAKILATTPIFDMTKLYNYIASIVQPKLLDDGSDAQLKDFTKSAEQVLMNYHAGPGSKLKSAKDTWWGAYNAITYFYDHQQGRSGQAERLYQSWLSHKNTVSKRNAFDAAVNFAKAA